MTLRFQYGSATSQARRLAQNRGLGSDIARSSWRSWRKISQLPAKRGPTARTHGDTIKDLHHTFVHNGQLSSAPHAPTSAMVS